MDALTNLQQRFSQPLLQEPGPDAEQLDNMFAAAMRAPDHAALRPWRFLVIDGDARGELGELYARAALQANPDVTEDVLTRNRKMTFRAPTIIVAIAVVTEHPKVPASEQLIAAGCAVQNMLLAANAQGVGAMWRTGGVAYDPVVKEGLGLAAHEEIIGFVYMGTPSKQRTAPLLDSSDYVSRWPA
ncbi:nitroreductase family protein [Aliamphritea spongicola]|uniref:nitroreductase family protein n=1 Tax=Aliamphritea spongicola TaxID=707589 RepID=UPI00196A73FA|nr:nitroreductase family protein [Aliamphritea spongicola]MBN3562641.1 nitroreductase family protein [Aliamphritea spongicola]